MDISILAPDSPFITLLTNGARGVVAPRDRDGALWTDREQLSRVCSACFWASLEMEEGREVRGTLVFCSPSGVRNARAFTQPAPVLVPHLVALLTASPRTPLAVHGGPEGPVIWGMLDVEPEEAVRLRMAGNGILLASRARRVLGILNRGVAAAPVAADDASLARLVAQTLGKERFLEQHGDMSMRFGPVLASMLRHGHGATLLLVPPDDQSWRGGVSFRYRFDEAGGRLLQHSVREHEILLREALQGYHDLISGRAKAETISGLREQYDAVNHLHALNDSLIRSVGDLGRIDGAVVMDTDLLLHGFGAKLFYGAEEFAVTVLDAVTGELRRGVPLAALGGMRHQSAARFIYANRETDAFVVSQDGRLCMISWSERTESLAVVRNLEHFLWQYRVF